MPEAGIEIAADDAPGAPVCRMTLSDITGRKQAEAALRENAERLQAVQRVAGVGYLDCNLVTNDIELSPAALEFYRLDTMATADELVSLVHPDDRERAAQGLAVVY